MLAGLPPAAVGDADARGGLGRPRQHQPPVLFRRVRHSGPPDPAGFETHTAELVTAIGASDGGARAATPDVALGRGLGDPAALLARWRAGGADLLGRGGLAAEDGVRVPWYGPAMSLASFTTARLMETWAHGTDVRDALGVPLEAGPRLRHVIHLGVAARTYAFAVHGVDRPGDPVRVEATAPDGTTWTWGPDDAADRVTGTALDLALVFTQRRHRATLGVTAEGPAAEAWLAVAQAFAGPPRSPTRTARPDRGPTPPMPAPVLPTAVDPALPRPSGRTRTGCWACSPRSTTLLAAGLARRRRARPRRGTGPRQAADPRADRAAARSRHARSSSSSPLAGYQTNYAVGGGMVLGIGVVEGTECVILGNDPTDLGGAMTTVSIRKLMRALEIARDNRMPYIQFVESAGGDLRGGSASGDDPEAAMRRNLTHFAESGRMFHDITELSAPGHPHDLGGVRQLHRRRRLPARACRTTTSSSAAAPRSSSAARRW